jgi:predicted dienelactone hydrolase
MMKRLSAFLLFVAAACGSSTPNQSATAIQTLSIGNYSADMGPSPVGVIPSGILHDAQRNKDLEVSIEYPTRGGPFPIIVFSHGYGSSDHGYEPLISYWTSNGYVCIRPSHADAGALRDTSRDTLPPAQQAPPRRGSPPQAQIIPLQPQRNRMEDIWDREREPQWRNRALDIKLVLDSLADLERQFPELLGKMDHARISVGGHSYGAFTALLIAGMNGSYADSRVQAVLAMSPPGPSPERGITPQSFATIKVPVMFMTGSNDRGANDTEDANWRKQAFDDSPPADKYFVLIDGARHSSFTGLVSFYEMQPALPTQTLNPYGQPQVQQQQPQQRGALVFGNDRRIFQMVKIASLAFWDAYLKNETSARELLQPQKFEAAFSSAHLTVK